VKQPEFSVVVPTHDRPAMLKAAVDSILSQTIEDIEVIVVDDCSTEHVSLSGDPRIRLVRRDNRGGPAAARNSGVALATGRYLAFCDDDDLFTPDRLEITLEGLQRAPISICWARYLDSTGQGDKGRFLEGDVFDVIAEQTTPPLGSTSVHRVVMLPFREDLDSAEDIDWWLRMSQIHEVTTAPRFGYLVRRHHGPRTATSKSRRIYDSQRLLQLHADYFDTHLKAAAFRWKRIGLLAKETGNTRLARRAFVRALKTRPSVADAAHLLRTFVAPMVPTKSNVEGPR